MVLLMFLDECINYRFSTKVLKNLYFYLYFVDKGKGDDQLLWINERGGGCG